jgi:hypothetical protein
MKMPEIWDVFCCFCDFLWSYRIISGLFVVHLDLEIWFVAYNLCAWWLMEDKDKI